jgi:hypothetical protein
MRRTIARLSAAAVLAFVAAVAVPLQAAAWTTTGCKYGFYNVGVQVGTMYSADHSTALSRAMTRWSINTDVDLFSAGSSNLDAYTENLNDLNLAGYSNWQCPFGGATVWSNARLNTQTTPSYPTEKKVTVWLHELGHALGLNHTGGLAAVMYECPACAYNNYGTVAPRPDDISGMNSLY